MTHPPVSGITITHRDDRVMIDVEGGHWEGSAAEAERLLTRLHYVLGRARPGTTIASAFVNGGLWGGKTIEADEAQALDDAVRMLEQLKQHFSKLAEELSQPTSLPAPDSP